MNRNDLVRIAADMKAEVSNGHTRTERVLDRTYIGLRKSDCGFELRIGRADTCPDPADAAVIAAAFDAPADDPTHIQCYLATHDGRSLPIKALRYTWIELPC